MLGKPFPESLIRAGAFDKLNSNRASLLASVNLAISLADQANANLGQNSLFAEADTQKINLIEMAPWEDKQQLSEEKIAIGFYVSGHPFKFYQNIISFIFLGIFYFFNFKKFKVTIQILNFFCRYLKL